MYGQWMRCLGRKSGYFIRNFTNKILHFPSKPPHSLIDRSQFFLTDYFPPPIANPRRPASKINAGVNKNDITHGTGGRLRCRS